MTRSSIISIKLAKVLVSKFPQDQNEQLWRYIQSQLMEGLEFPHGSSQANESTEHMQPNNHAMLNGRKNSEEEEIDDDEETALNEEQEEIDDDEETAIVERSQEEKMTMPQGLPQNFSRTQP